MDKSDNPPGKQKASNKFASSGVEKKIDAYRQKHGEKVTKEDYKKYKDSFLKKSVKEKSGLQKPLSFTHYKSMSGFYGKKMTEDADLELVMKAGFDPESYRTVIDSKSLNPNMKKSRGASDYRKGGMVLNTVDRRKRK